MRNLGFMLAAALLGSGAAHAQVQSAMAGHGWPVANDTCFSSSYAQVTNMCATPDARLWIIPIQVPGTGNYTASVHAGGAPAYNGASCQAMAINSSNAGWSFSSKQATFGSASQTLRLGVIGVPPGGTVHFECQVGGWISDLNGGGAGARVINVELD